MPSVFVNALVLLVGGSVFVAMGLGRWIAVTVAAVLIVVLLVTAYVAWRMMHLPGRPPVEPAEAESADVPAVVREQWQSAGVQLGECGYRWYGASRHEFGPRSATLYQAAWVDARGAELVSVAVPIFKERAVEPPTYAVSTWLRDGRSIETSTCRDRPSLGRIEGLELGLFPGLTDLASLVAVHRRRLELWAPAAEESNRTPREADPQEEYVKVYRRTSDSALANGYLRLSRDLDGFVPTLRGFLRTTLVNFWPVRAMLRVLERRRAAGFLREVGFIEGGSDGRARWLVTSVAIIMILLAMRASLGAAAWSWLGIAFVVHLQQRRGRRVGPGTVLTGGMLAVLVFVGILVGQGEFPLLIGSTLYVFPQGMYLDLRAPVAFVLGATALFWGWSGIPYLHPLPAKVDTST